MRPIKVESAVVCLVLSLTPDEANGLYNDLCSLLRAVGLHQDRDKGGALTQVGALYNALYTAGIDGTGGSS